MTSKKYQALNDKYPEFLPVYASEEDVRKLAPEDQKLFAEVVYSWLINRIDNMDTAYDLDYLFCVLTDEPYDEQFILFIAAGDGARRGNEPGDIYPIGKILKASAEQQEAIRKAAEGEPQSVLNKDGRYIDYFYPLSVTNNHLLLIGVTHDVKVIKETVFHQTLSQSWLSVLYLIDLMIVCLVIIYYAVLRPLKKIQENIRLYKDTKNSETIIENLSEIRSHNELGLLSNDVSDLAKEIDDYLHQIEKITSERERIDTELKLASHIQNAMLPNKFPAYPESEEFDIFASMDPAREIGGDFYDLFMTDKDHLCILIADVSGKGVPAALFMMASKITFSHNIGMKKTPAQILTAANAGHEYPILKDAKGNYELFKDKHGIVLGSIPDTVYTEYEIKMEKGSVLFLYTDGLPEAKDPDGQMFGLDRVIKELNAQESSEPEDILHNMKDAVRAYEKGTEPFDDLTMMCPRYNGPAQ